MITDFMGDTPDVERQIFADAGLRVAVAPERDPKSWIAEARHAEAILTRHAPITRDVINQLRRCKVISRYGTGTDNIDLAAAGEQGIVVTNVPDYSTSEVADHGWAMAMALWRRLPLFRTVIRHGGWQPTSLPGIGRMEGSTLGLIGCGRIGSAVGRRARACGMEVIAYDPFLTDHPEGIELVDTVDDVARRAHIVSLHSPLTPDTSRIVDGAFLSRSRPGLVLVNVARGGLVDLQASTEALEAGRLGGLGLDVFEEEPLSADHPLRTMENVLLSPHVAYYSTESVVEAKRRSCEEIIRVLAGESPAHAVGTEAPG